MRTTVLSFVISVALLLVLLSIVKLLDNREFYFYVLPAISIALLLISFSMKKYRKVAKGFLIAILIFYSLIFAIISVLSNIF